MRNPTPINGWMDCIVIALACQMSVCFAGPAAPTKWVATEDGTVVINLNAKLAWTRCVQGMHWNGNNCAGKPALLSHAEAMALAHSRAASDWVEWRLPTVMELKHLTAQSKDPSDPQAALFSGAPGGWYWAGTGNVSTTEVNQYNYANILQGRTSAIAKQRVTADAWAVNWTTGQTNGDVARRSKLPVLLVSAID